MMLRGARDLADLGTSNLYDCPVLNNFFNYRDLIRPLFFHILNLVVSVYDFHTTSSSPYPLATPDIVLATPDPLFVNAMVNPSLSRPVIV